MSVWRWLDIQYSFPVNQKSPTCHLLYYLTVSCWSFLSFFISSSVALYEKVSIANKKITQKWWREESDKPKFFSRHTHEKLCSLMFLKRKWKQLKPIAAESRLLLSPVTSGSTEIKRLVITQWKILWKGKKFIYSWNLLSRPQIIL